MFGCLLMQGAGTSRHYSAIDTAHKKRRLDYSVAVVVWLQVLGFLNQKRPVDVDRESVYLQADAFAALVQMDFVAADGKHGHTRGWACTAACLLPPAMSFFGHSGCVHLGVHCGRSTKGCTLAALGWDVGCKCWHV